MSDIYLIERAAREEARVTAIRIAMLAADVAKRAP